MFAQERQARILSLLHQRGRLPVRQLQKLLEVSSATLRRDLTVLAENDQVVRVHGGVFCPGAPEASLGEKASQSVLAKRRIAKKVAESIPLGATVFIDSGTTCLEAGRLLRTREDLMIVTNSLPLIRSYDQFRGRLMVLGGEMRLLSGALVGDLAIAVLGFLRADIALIGASGLDARAGVGTTESTEFAIKRQWIQKSQRTFLLADSSKWNENPLLTFATWNKFDKFYTDKSPPARLPKGAPKIVIS